MDTKRVAVDQDAIGRLLIVWVALDQDSDLLWAALKGLFDRLAQRHVDR